MRAPRCVSAFPITNLKRRRLRRQSSFPLSAVCDRLRPLPVPILLRAAFPFSPLAPIPLPALRSLFYHSLPPRSHGCVPVAARNCSCISRPRQRRKKKEGRRKRRTRRRVGSTGAVRRTSRDGDEIRVLGTSPIPTFLNSETDLCVCPVNYIEFS